LNEVVIKSWFECDCDMPRAALHRFYADGVGGANGGIFPQIEYDVRLSKMI